MGAPEIPFPENRVEDLTPPTLDAREAEHGPDNPPWGVLVSIGIFLLSLALMFVVQFVFIAGYLVYRVFYRGANISAEAGGMMQDPAAIFVAVISIIPAHALTLGVAWAVVTGMGKRSFFHTLGWDWGRGFNLRLGGWRAVLRLNFWLCAAIAVVLLAVGLLVIKLTGNPPTELDRLIESSRATALVTAFLATFSAPFVEEVIYRGVIYSPIERAAGKVWAVTIVGLLFTLIHVLQYRQSYGVIATIAILSFALTLIRAHTGRLLPCFVVHLIFNAIQSLLIVLNPYIEQLSPEQTPAPVAPPAPGALLHALVQLFQARL